MTTKIPIDRDGNPIKEMTPSVPSQPTAMAKAFSNSASDQLTPPTVEIKDNPKPTVIKTEAVILPFPTVHVASGVKKNPVHIPHPSTVDKTLYATKVESIPQGVVELDVSQGSLDNLEKEKKFLFKLAYTAANNSVYVPSTEAKARQEARLITLATHEHDAKKLAQKKFSATQRRVALEHMAMIKENSDVSDFYHGSVAIQPRDAETNVLIKEHGEIQARKVVQTTSTPSNTGCEGVFKDKIWGVPNPKMVASAARNDPSWQPDKVTVAWYAHNVKPNDWPEDMKDNIQAHLATLSPVLGDGETYRRSVLINSYEQQIKGLKAEIDSLDEELLNTTAELSLVMWSHDVERDDARDVRNTVHPMGNRPTPSLPVLRNQLKTYMTLYRSDPVKQFMRSHGYNANDSNKLVTYNKLKRLQLKAVRTETAALNRIGSNIRSSLDNRRKEQYRLYVSDLGIRREKQQAAIDVGGSLPKEVEVYRKWGRQGFIDKPYLTNEYRVTPDRKIDNEYVAWYTEAVRLRDEPTHSERLEKLLEKPVNRMAYGTVQLGKVLKKVLTTDINPYTINKKKKAQLAKEVRREKNKQLKREAKVDKALAKTERDSLRTAMRIAH